MHARPSDRPKDKQVADVKASKKEMEAMVDANRDMHVNGVYREV